MEGTDWSTISPREDEKLVDRFTIEEIKKVVFSCNGKKAPGADEFSMAFFQEIWGSNQR